MARCVTGTLFAALGLFAGLAGDSRPAAADAEVDRGKYLAAIMDCGGCHTGGALMGKPDPARYLAGSEVGFEVPGLGIFYPPNLTPDATTGLGRWSLADIAKAVRTGERPDGRVLAPVMPWMSYAALSDADATALARFLKSLAPVAYAAPQPIGAGEKPTAPYMTVKVP